MIMMTLSTMISQPVWILVSLIGVADILILLWCITLIRRNRNRRAMTRDELALLQEQPAPSGQFQQNLACMQIDAVFDGLAALIETERIKLKSMILPAAAPFMPESVSLHKDQEEVHDSTENFFQRQTPDLPLDQQITRFAASGKKPAAIASQLGISLAEVDLAMRMRTDVRSGTGYKLEAVA
jgi:hypothetical protein